MGTSGVRLASLAPPAPARIPDARARIQRGHAQSRPGSDRARHCAAAGSVTACRKKATLTCHAERQRSIWFHQPGGMAHLGFFAALRMTCPGHFLMACRMLAPHHRSAPQATRKGLTRGGFWTDRPGNPMEKRSQCHHFRRPLKRLYNKFFQKTSPCKPARGGPHRRELKPVRARRRPRARGGPTIYERVVGLVERSYIVGPPLAGGLPGARTALS